MKPLLTVLNFSGGRQSSCLLWMVLRGDLLRPKNFLVINADPGMGHQATNAYIEMMFTLVWGSTTLAMPTTGGVIVGFVSFSTSH